MCEEVINQCANNDIIWPFDDGLDQCDWSKKMEVNGCFVDHIGIQICANFLGRNILIIPTKTQSLFGGGLYNIVRPVKLLDTAPIILLYFEETVYRAGHFQSLSVNDNKSKVIEVYNHSLQLDQNRSNATTTTTRNMDSTLYMPRNRILSSVSSPVPILGSSRIRSRAQLGKIIKKLRIVNYFKKKDSCFASHSPFVYCNIFLKSNCLIVLSYIFMYI